MSNRKKATAFALGMVLVVTAPASAHELNPSVNSVKLPTEYVMLDDKKSKEKKLICKKAKDGQMPVKKGRKVTINYGENYRDYFKKYYKDAGVKKAELKNVKVVQKPKYIDSYKNKDLSVKAKKNIIKKRIGN